MAKTSSWESVTHVAATGVALRTGVNGCSQGQTYLAQPSAFFFQQRHLFGGGDSRPVTRREPVYRAARSSEDVSTGRVGQAPKVGGPGTWVAAHEAP